MHIVDLYATLLGRAGISAADGDSPVPVDSVDVWDWWSGSAAASPRTTAVFDHDMFNVSGNGVTGGEGDAGESLRAVRLTRPPGLRPAALRQGRYKLLVGPPQGEWQASWYGLFSPNASTPKVDENIFACRCEGGGGGLSRSAWPGETAAVLYCAATPAHHPAAYSTSRRIQPSTTTSQPRFPKRSMH